MASTIKVDTIENVAGSGNVSLGSGHNLVVPGNITGSGDLTVDTDTLKVDSTNNRVGINTTTMAESLTINNGDIRLKGGSDNRIQFFNSDAAYSLGSSGGAAIRFHRPSSGHEGIEFETHDTGVHHSTTMKISPEGYVTKSRQPAFSTYGTAGDVSFSTEATITAWNSMIFNVGNHFNTSTGKFTAPVRGKYFFRAQLYVQNSTGVCRFRLYKNTSVAVYHYYNVNMTPGPANIQGFLTLAANDTVHLTFNADNATNVYFADNHSNFDGYLVM